MVRGVVVLRIDCAVPHKTNQTKTKQKKERKKNKNKINNGIEMNYMSGSSSALNLRHLQNLCAIKQAASLASSPAASPHLMCIIFCSVIRRSFAGMEF
jgi:hypothetical protein